MLINKTTVKAFALGMASNRAHKFTQVSNGLVMRCEAQMKNFIRSEVQRHPSKGKTIT